MEIDIHDKTEGLWKEFKNFALKGNVIDLAVAVVIGTAFGKIVSSLANNIILPFFGVLIGGVDFSELSVEVGKAEITYGVFVQSIIDFIVIAIGIFIAIRIFNIFKKKEEAKEKEKEKIAPSEPKEEILLLREIRDELKK